MASGDDRKDPVEILARVGGVSPGFGGAQRAFDVWVSLARKAGWDVVVEPDAEHRAATMCGVVMIEGIRYAVHYGRRVRRMLVEVVAGEAGQRPVLGYAAWVEPVAGEAPDVT